MLSFEPGRAKRGLINGLGSIIKGISGNLDYTDALRYDTALKILSSNENKLFSEFNNHISLSKEWMSRHSNILNTIANNQAKIKKVLDTIMISNYHHGDELVRYAHFAQFLLILGDNIDKLFFELLRIDNILAFVRASSTYHSSLSRASLKEMLIRLKSLYNLDELLDVDIREYYDLIKVGSYYANSEVILVFKFPIVSPKVYSLFKLSIIPNKFHESIIPPLPYVAIHEKDYVYMETECPKFNPWYLCEEKFNHQLREEPDCIRHLLAEQRIYDTCKPTRINLTMEAHEQLDEKHYTLSFPRPTRVHTSCSQDEFHNLQGSYLATIPQNCDLQTPEFTISNRNDRIKGQVIKISQIFPEIQNTSGPEGPTLQLHSINLEALQATNTKLSLQPPIQPEQVTDYSLYHTTIPIYAILFSASALIIALILRNRRNKATIAERKDNPETSNVPEGIYAEIQDKAKVDPHFVTATFSRTTLK